MKIQVGVSNRHCHLTKEIFKELFQKEELTFLKDLKQPNQYAAVETITIKGPKGQIDNVRVLGPFRSYNQVEVSKTDCYKLGIDAPVRKSGDLTNASSLVLVGPHSEIKLDCGIIANRHIHISKKDAEELNVKDNERALVNIKGIKPGVIVAQYKVSDSAYMELHLDTDDANAFMLKQDDEVEIVDK